VPAPFAGRSITLWAEEPHLRVGEGAIYENYCRMTPRWLKAVVTPGPRWRAGSFLILYAALVLYLSLYPWIISAQARTPGLVWVPLASPRLEFDFALNILFYVPVGASAFVLFGGGIAGLAGATLTGFALSLGVEWTQRFIPLRSANLDDLAANTMGSAAGALLALASRRKPSGGAMLAWLWVMWNASLILPALNNAPLPTEGLDAALLWIGSMNAFVGVVALISGCRDKPVMTVVALAPLLIVWVYPSLAVARLAAAICGVLVARYSGEPLS
jgi:VanZ family protein